MSKETNGKSSDITRRGFMKASAAVSLSALASGVPKAFAAGSDTFRIGLIGTGWRGSQAAVDAVKASKGVEIVALGDLFQYEMDNAIKKFKEEVGDKFKATPDRCFIGFDAYKKVLALEDVNMVILGTPPHYRPEHLKASVEAGKQIFMEKPVAVDPKGIRSVIDSSELAKRKGLGIVCGTQRRHQPHYLEIMKRVHNGDIGEIRSGYCYWNGHGKLHWKEHWKERKPGWSDMEWQNRRWVFFTWLGGDHIVEQDIHGLDILNWAMGSHPVKARGVGGRQVRSGEAFGNVFDHFSIEYYYPNGARTVSVCQQIDGCWESVSEHIIGSKGMAYTDRSNGHVEGPNAYKYDGPNPNPYEVEQADLIASIRKGEPLNEGRRIAESTLTAIMGRMCAYTGREISWEWLMKGSKLDLTPPKYEWIDLPPEFSEIAVPGKTKLV